MAFDVFLSYHWRDHAAVHKVAHALRERGRTVFLDRWYLVPGRPWQETLEKELASCGAVAVFYGPHGMGPWQQRERGLALNRQAKTPNFVVVPVLLPGLEASEAPLGFLSLNTWIDLTEDLDNPQELARLDRAVRGLPPGPDLPDRTAAITATICPYRGLRPFREEDAAFFFGREKDTDRLHAAVQAHALVAVVGGSGSGKSSLVRAGLVPRLRRRDGGGPVWEIVTLVPEDRPFRSLAAALLPLLEHELDKVARLDKIQELADKLASGRIALRDVVTSALKEQPGTDRLLLVVDQWEELYTLCSDAKLRTDFIDALLAATAVAPLTVVLTVRADFYGHVTDYRPLIDRLEHVHANARAMVSLGPMDRHELESVVERPAQAVHLTFESGLVKRILDDVEQEPGHLPLLEFALTQLWKNRSEARLTHKTYEEMGGLAGAMARRADAFFDGLQPPEQDLLHRLFIQLVRPGEGTEDTRRRARLVELPEGTRPLVQKLAGERLVVTSRQETTGEETVEVAHEALIRGWERVRGWMSEDREFRSWQERLRAALREWEANKKETSALLTGSRLADAERWLAKRPGEVLGREREFIGTGTAYRETLERRHKRTVRIAVAAALVMFGLSVVAIGLYFHARGETARAEEALALAEANSLVNWGYGLFEDEPLLGVRLMFEGLARVPENRVKEREVLGYRIADKVKEGRLASLGKDIRILELSRDGLHCGLAFANKTGAIRSLDGKTLVPFQSSFEPAFPRGDPIDLVRVKTKNGLKVYRMDGTEVSFPVKKLDSFDSVHRYRAWVLVNAKGRSKDGLDYGRGGILFDLAGPGLKEISRIPDETTIEFPDPSGSYYLLRNPDGAVELYRVSPPRRIDLPGKPTAVRFGFSEVPPAYHIVDYDLEGHLYRRSDDRRVELGKDITNVTDFVGPFALLRHSNGQQGWARLDGAAVEVLPATLPPWLDMNVSDDARLLCARYKDSEVLYRSNDGKRLFEAGKDQQIRLDPDQSGRFFIVEKLDDEKRPIDKWLHRSTDGMPVFLPKKKVADYFFLQDHFIAEFVGGSVSLYRVKGVDCVKSYARANAQFGGSHGSFFWIQARGDQRWTDLYRIEDGVQVPLKDGKEVPLDLVSISDYPGEQLPYFLARHKEGTSLFRWGAKDVPDPVHVTTNDALLRLGSVEGVGGRAGPRSVFTIAYEGRSAELWDMTSDSRLLTLGENVTSIFEVPDDRAVVHYGNGRAYLLDLAWLRAMKGSPQSLSDDDMLRIARDGPFKRGMFDEKDLEPFLKDRPAIAWSAIGGK